MIRKWRLDARAIWVVPNPVDVDLFCPGDAPPSGDAILYVGRVERRKGVETLVRALPILRNEFVLVATFAALCLAYGALFLLATKLFGRSLRRQLL